MSIVKMKRLRLIGLSEERDELVAQLLHLGCVEVTEPEDKLTDPEWMALVRRDSSNLSDVKAQAGTLTSALDALKKYAPAKTGLFIKRSNITEAELFDNQVLGDALRCADDINDRTREIARLYSQENKVNAVAAGLAPWTGLDLPLEVQETVSADVMLGVCPATVELSALQGDLAAATPLAELQTVSDDKTQHYLLLVCHKAETEAALNALRPHSFSVVRFKDMTGTAAENMAELKRQLSDLADQRQAQVDAIVSHKEERNRLQVCLDRVNQDINKAAVCERFLTDGRIFFLEGWVPEENLPQVTEALRSFTAAYESVDREPEEKPPVKLKNPKWMDGINMVTEMYSLPDYDGIDPNPLIFFWFVLFFGIMFADVAYGLIIFVVSFIITKVYAPKKTMGKMFSLAMWLGGSTAVMGIFTGGFFGNFIEIFYETFLPNAVMPGWLESFCNGLVVSPINDPMTVLIIAIVLGCVQLIMGQCIHIYMGFRDGNGLDGLLDVVPWWIVFAGIGLLFLGQYWLLIVGVVALIATQGRHSPTIIGKIFGGISSLYDITSWLSDVLSYSRLMALMLATSVIAMVFNTLAAMPRNIIAFFIIFAFGHVLNIAVNIIGTFVHAARLQYLEYFGKFYKEGGVPFAPLQYDTKYVDVIDNKEEI
ncbi:MAG: V-type ATP synthase subunit I [Oscillospiraceae bacterium]|nr:V-type ATP synthase subunit I [Oscillospiraceae bacterium]